MNIWARISGMAGTVPTLCTLADCSVLTPSFKRTAVPWPLEQGATEFRSYRIGASSVMGAQRFHRLFKFFVVTSGERS